MNLRKNLDTTIYPDHMKKIFDKNKKTLEEIPWMKNKIQLENRNEITVGKVLALILIIS